MSNITISTQHSGCTWVWRPFPGPAAPRPSAAANRGAPVWRPPRATPSPPRGSQTGNGWAEPAGHSGDGTWRFTETTQTSSSTLTAETRLSFSNFSIFCQSLLFQEVLVNIWHFITAAKSGFNLMKCCDIFEVSTPGERARIYLDCQKPHRASLQKCLKACAVSNPHSDFIINNCCAVLAFEPSLLSINQRDESLWAVREFSVSSDW